jgi:hypothetical protein
MLFASRERGAVGAEKNKNVESSKQNHFEIQHLPLSSVDTTIGSL